MDDSKLNQNSEAINSALYRISELVFVAEDMTQFFSKIHQIIGQITYAENFFIALYDEGHKTISFPYSVDTASDIDANFLSNLPAETINNSLTGYMLRTKKMLHANADLMKRLFQQGKINFLGERSHEWLGFPLISNGKILGAMVVQSYRQTVSYGNKDIELLKFVSQHVATALTRLTADKALRESEKRLREVLDTSNIMFYKFDLISNSYEYVSNNIKPVTGYAVEDIQELDLEELKRRIHPDDRQMYKQQFKDMIRNAAIDEHSIIPAVEYRWQFKGEDYRWFSDSRTVICDKAGNVVTIIGSVKEISDRKKYQFKLKEIENELHKKQQLENIGVLAGGMAHDFNNILTGIFGNIALAKMALSHEHPSVGYLNQTELALGKAKDLTGQLLTFAKGGEPKREEVDLTSLIEETTLFDLKSTDVKPVFDFHDQHLIASVDKEQMQQLISNLVVNADQAMPKGGHLHISIEKIEVYEDEISMLNDGDFIKVEIRDDGEGIDSNNLNRIFDPYFTTRAKGSGLGLTTAYSIIKRHGGQINVKSEVGKGTTFSIFLPFIKPSQQHIAEQSEEKKEMLKERKVLVMDDDEMILSLVTSILELNDFSVVTCLNGEQAIEIYKKSMREDQPFDVVIMDLTIPSGMGGKTAVKELLNIDPNAKCIVSSGYADDPIMANFNDYGFKGVISKPFAVEDLIDTLEQVIQ